MDDLLLDPFVRLLEQVSDPAAVRRAESGEGQDAIWDALSESGFADALVSEDKGGAGLTPADMAPLFIACGRHLLPAAFAETTVARALASEGGSPLEVTAPVLLWPLDEAGQLRSLVPPPSGGASHALVQRGNRVELRTLTANRTERDGFGLIAATLDESASPLASFDLAEGSLLNWAAALTTAAIAGAATRVLELTLSHVNDRQQFGRPLAKFQAIQQQAAVLAERVAMTNVAARLALSRPMPGPGVAQAALGKVVADEAAVIACTIAHAAHGAIGISEEHDLSLYVRRLKRWQVSFGSAAQWARRLGEIRLAETTGTSVDFLRAQQAAP